MSDVPEAEGGAPGATPPEPAAPRGEHTAAFQAKFRAARSEFEQHAAHARGQFDEANERIKERTGRDLILAIAIGVAIGVVTVSSLVFVKWTFLIFALAAVGLAVFELARALQAGGRRIDLAPQLAVVPLLLVSAYFGDLWLHWSMLFAGIALVVVWRLMAQMVAQDGRVYADVLADAVVSAFVPVYVTFLASIALVLLREDGGEWWVLAFIIVVVIADTGAYAAGLAFGRHPMAPRISPKKTWEGLAGAVVASLAAGALLAQFMLGLPWWAGLIIGAVLVGTATAGDLGESMLKRDLGIKDMSSWLPGHGGVLDRLDSILPSATAALALHHLLSPLGAA
ncbi:phosphatidate cytidylyltransferase [Microbacterium marinilacus]|uniref:Phosphatidate cytidylyltransferase n=1 Tax=Microbacterium marinilacus TaxID=415209 RepID=A0ABP7B464_9MICO|nr:phosphatidate cytidylyltransferase [Microbacterium marinilacus]MBY0687982.1 phosphatidate cytidylyltransferase [Microbacterium marinilacus]